MSGARQSEHRVRQVPKLAYSPERRQNLSGMTWVAIGIIAAIVVFAALCGHICASTLASI